MSAEQSVNSIECYICLQNPLSILWNARRCLQTTVSILLNAVFVWSTLCQFYRMLCLQNPYSILWHTWLCLQNTVSIPRNARLCLQNPHLLQQNACLCLQNTVSILWNVVLGFCRCYPFSAEFAVRRIPGSADSANSGSIDSAHSAV